MEAILFGFGVSVITWLSGFLKMSKTYVALGLCFIGGAIYVVMTTRFNTTRQEVIIFASAVYATSQVIYNLIKKRGVFEKIGF